jgi:Protein of unknown function (DUF2950)
MTSTSANVNLSKVLPILSTLLGVLLCTSVLSVAEQSPAKKAPAAAGAPSASITTFDTPQQAADALVEAADKFDVVALSHMFGPGGEGVVFSGEFAQDRKHAADFAAEAHEKESVSVNPKTGNRAFILVGNEDWPFPVPIVKSGNKWFFDGKVST